MSNENEGPGLQAADEFGRTFAFRGKIGRGKYLLWLIAELGVLFIGLMALAGLNNPTGGGNIFVAMIFPLIALYLHMCAVTARVRDAGATYPVPLGMIIAILPFAWVLLLIESIEYIWPLILAGFLIFYLGPLAPKSKAAAPLES